MTEKKLYDTPSYDEIPFAVEDVITCSGEGQYDPGNEGEGEWDEQ